MKYLWVVLLALIPALTGISRAKGNNPVVIELYTSQSCAPCLPADRLIRDMDHHQDMLPLTLPVTYWDMLGWKDTLASKSTTDRQKAYAKFRRSGSVYTPQIIVDGRFDIIGNRTRDVRKTIGYAVHQHPAEIPVRIDVRHDRDDGYMIQLSDNGAPLPHPATIWLMTLRRHAAVHVKNGENKGRLLKYYNVVESISNLGDWHGQPRILHVPEKKLQLPKDGALAILVQQDGYGPILAASYYHPKK